MGSDYGTTPSLLGVCRVYPGGGRNTRRTAHASDSTRLPLRPYSHVGEQTPGQYRVQSAIMETVGVCMAQGWRGSRSSEQRGDGNRDARSQLDAERNDGSTAAHVHRLDTRHRWTPPTGDKRALTQPRRPDTRRPASATTRLTLARRHRCHLAQPSPPPA